MNGTQPLWLITGPKDNGFIFGFISNPASPLCGSEAGLSKCKSDWPSLSPEETPYSSHGLEIKCKLLTEARRSSPDLTGLWPAPLSALPLTLPSRTVPLPTILRHLQVPRSRTLSTSTSLHLLFFPPGTPSLHIGYVICILVHTSLRPHLLLQEAFPAVGAPFICSWSTLCLSLSHHIP